MAYSQRLATIDGSAAEHQASYKDGEQQMAGDAAENRNKGEYQIQDQADHDDENPRPNRGSEKPPAFAPPSRPPGCVDRPGVDDGCHGFRLPGRRWWLFCHGFLPRHTEVGPGGKLSTGRGP